MVRITRKHVGVLALSTIAVLTLAATIMFGHSEIAHAQLPSTCDVARDQAGNLPRCLEVIKQTIPDGSPGSFQINISGAFGGSQNLSDGQSFQLPIGGLNPPAVITLTETVPAGWVVSVSCVGAGVTTSPVANGVQITYNGNGNPYSYARCTFTNSRPNTSTPTPTVTGTVPPTSTSTPTSTATATPTATPGIFEDRPNVGGIFQPLPPQPNRVAPAPTTVAPLPIKPPSTGDAGLK